MRILHLAVGISTVVVFLGTGLYMRQNFPQLYEGNEVIRYLFRANHVYILFAGLLNVLLGLYGSVSSPSWRQKVRTAGSLLVVLTAPILLTAFIVEPPSASPDRPLTLIGVFAAITGVMFHLIGGGVRHNGTGVRRGRRKP